MAQVSISQVRSRALAPRENADSTCAAIERAADDGADVVILPELAASGYVLDGEALRSVAESVDSPGLVLTAWQQAAVRHQVAIIGGFAECDQDRLYNAAVTISPDGSIASVYRKLHLFGREHGCFHPGDHGLPVVQVNGLNIGVLVCYDLRFVEAMRILAARGAELIAVPTAWVAGFDRSPTSKGMIRQVEGAIVQANLNQVYVACADTVGALHDQVFLGRSVAIDPFGEMLVGPLSHDQQQQATFTVDLDHLMAARHRGASINPWENRRVDVYGHDLGYIEPGQKGR